MTGFMSFVTCKPAVTLHRCEVCLQGCVQAMFGMLIHVTDGGHAQRNTRRVSSTEGINNVTSYFVA